MFGIISRLSRVWKGGVTLQIKCIKGGFVVSEFKEIGKDLISYIKIGFRNPNGKNNYQILL